VRVVWRPVLCQCDVVWCGGRGRVVSKVSGHGPAWCECGVEASVVPVWRPVWCQCGVVWKEGRGRVVSKVSGPSGASVVAEEEVGGWNMRWAACLQRSVAVGGCSGPAGSLGGRSLARTHHPHYSRSRPHCFAPALESNLWLMRLRRRSATVISHCVKSQESRASMLTSHPQDRPCAPPLHSLTLPATPQAVITPLSSQALDGPIHSHTLRATPAGDHPPAVLASPGRPHSPSGGHPV